MENKYQKHILETLIETTNVGILVEDENRVILKVNTAFINLFSIPLTQEQLIGQDCAPMAAQFNDFFLTKTLFSDFIDEIIKANKAVERVELETITKRFLALSYFPVVFKDGSNGIIWQYEEITKQKYNEQQLKENKARFETVLNSINEIFFQLDEEGFLTYISKGIEALTGYTVLDVIGKHYFELPFITFLDTRGDILNELSKEDSGQIFTRQYLLTLKTGDHKWILLKARALFTNGVFKGIVGTGTDITNEKYYSDQLTETNNLLNIISEAQTLYIKTNSAFHSLTFMLRKVIEITNSGFGFIGEILLDEHGNRYLKSHATSNIAWDKDTMDLYQKNVATGLEFRNNNSLFGHVVLTGELYISNDPKNDPHSGGTPKGHPPLNSFVGIPIYNGEKLMGMIGLANKDGGYKLNELDPLNPLLSTIAAILESFINYQQTVKAKQKLSEKELNLVSILSSFEDEVLEVNDAFEIVNIWSNKRKDISSPNTSGVLGNIINFFPEDMAEMVSNGIQSVFSTGQPLAFDYTVSLSANSVVWFSAKINLVELKGLKHASVLIQDITLRKKVESDLLNLLTKERELNELKTKFVSMTSHEFRTPLTGIQTSSELIEILLKKDASQETKEKIFQYVEIIRKEIYRINNLMNDVLTLGKLDSGRYKVALEEINLLDLLEQMSLKFAEIYPGSELIFEMEKKAQLLVSDKRLLGHILDNLIHNGLKYSKEQQKVWIKTYLTQEGFNLDILDLGIGIPEQEQKYLFESFFRATNAENIQGTGLGLVIVKNMVELLSGTIAIKSDLNKGTKISICLPNNK
ncbi:MAG: hypothetical protein CFE21_09850 [Bacteroidetes bacterium B1(2017)]|nr:MAG: hypothetical protein CFE21_09850 [Bacteroidetes bacterium B1(2017)]